MKISLLITGTELLDGRIADANGNVFGKRLADLGLRLNMMLACGDTTHEIREGIAALLPHSDLLVVSGGLGPTEADQTRPAFGLELIYDEQSEKKLRDMMASRNRRFNDNLLKQCYLPKGAIRFDNPVGSADPFMVTLGNTKVIAVPGVPREFNAILETLIIPQISQLAMERSFELIPCQECAYRFLGLTESEVATLLQKAELGSTVEIFIRAVFPEIQLVLRAEATETSFAGERAKLEGILPVANIYSRSLESSFESALVSLLRDEEKTLAVAESCTGGLISSLITSVAGSSAVFLGSIVPYANEIKEHVLGVSSNTLARFGAVSAECAAEMSLAIKKKFRSDYGLSVTGIAGPGGGTAEKPVGLVYIGLSTPLQTYVSKLEFQDERRRVQIYTAYAALDEVRRNLLNFSPRLEVVKTIT